MGNGAEKFKFKLREAGRREARIRLAATGAGVPLIRCDSIHRLPKSAGPVTRGPGALMKRGTFFGSVPFTLMNLANRLTLARFFLTLGFVAALSVQAPFARTVALLLFLVAGVTDYADGEIARRMNMETDFGRLMDPLVDKIMMAAAFICLVPFHAIPAWAATVIVSREFLITGLRLLAAAKGRVLAAESLGKHKTAWQIITAIFFLLMLSLREWAGMLARPVWYEPLWKWCGAALLVVTVVLTLVSGAGYLWKNWGVVEE